MRENELLQHIYAANAALPAGVTIPPGDDMGGIQLGNRTLLVTVDQLADGVHVDLTTTSLAKVGRKAITRNLSDVAAMAAKPIGAVAAACLPRDFGEANATALFDAMRTTAAAFDCPLVGGDISVWDGRLIITVTIFAEPFDGIPPVLRTGATPGDAIYVSGELGYSLQGHHLDFTPRLALARALAADSATRPTAMMDLSDGLAQDLPRLTPHALIDAAALPIRDDASGEDEGHPSWHHAVADGEDYELLFTARADASIPERLEGVALTRIGVVTESGGVLLQHPNGQHTDLAGLGWEHHA